jgi:hypothetical protein
VLVLGGHDEPCRLQMVSASLLTQLIAQGEIEEQEGYRAFQSVALGVATDAPRAA